MPKQRLDYVAMFNDHLKGMSSNAISAKYSCHERTVGLAISIGKHFYEEYERRMKDEVKKDPLEKFTPRQLMLELVRRGYTGTLSYTREVSIEDLVEE